MMDEWLQASRRGARGKGKGDPTVTHLNKTRNKQVSLK